jgi:hypothetical protein
MCMEGPCVPVTKLAIHQRDSSVSSAVIRNRKTFLTEDFNGYGNDH